MKKAFEKLASQKTQEPFKSHNGQDLPSIKRSSSGSGEDTEMPKKKKNRAIITKKELTEKMAPPGYRDKKKKEATEKKWQSL